jgi:hypothetical protein
MVRFRKCFRILAWKPTVTTVGYEKIDKAKKGIFSIKLRLLPIWRSV